MKMLAAHRIPHNRTLPNIRYNPVRNDCPFGFIDDIWTIPEHARVN